VKWNFFFEMYDLYQKLKEIADRVDRSIIRKALNLTREESPLNKAFLAYIEARENKDEDRKVASLMRESIDYLGENALNVVLQFVDLHARKS
jgi:CRISPR-associated protein Csm1